MNVRSSNNNRMNQHSLKMTEKEELDTIDHPHHHAAAAEGSMASYEPETIAQSKKGVTTDAKIARGARTVVMIVLLLSAITVATLAYILLSQSEKDAYQAEFQSSARQVILMANRNAVNVFTGIKTFASVFPTATEATTETFPFVTLRGFEALATGFRNTTKVMALSWAPVINTPEELQAWGPYSVNHSTWIADGRKYHNQPTDPKSEMIVPFAYKFDMQIQGIAPDMGPFPITPSWQWSPVPVGTNYANFNWLQTPILANPFRYVLANGKPDLTPPFDAQNTLKLDVEGPVSLAVQPIFDTVSPQNNSKVVGMLTATLAWKHFLEDVLPQGQNGIHVVIDSCTELSTFQIDGPVATFRGYGDLHHSHFDDMAVTTEFIRQIEYKDATRQCRHLIHVYPTHDLENMYITNTPRNYAIVVVAIFVFAALVFVAYDWFVTNRQNRTERSADQSNAIVQELFPGDTAQRLFASPTSSMDVDHNKSSLVLSGFGKVDRTTIAELHPEATVLFADISGFTAWSSMRDPHQVFTLLEAIFQAFDAIAKRCGVFKVETIGDCYVAACGVPKENLKHAVVMCRFARNAMTKFRSVCRSLELLLGPDTSDLALRIGMHSGPVTAGVLRGDRARFQLFGDTVNTASRIESTGLRERVHLSEQTAKQLIKQGKEDWIVRRDDVVEAKGKGKLVTYWLKLSNLTKTTGSVAGSSVIGDEDKVAIIAKDVELDTCQWNIEMPASKPDAANARIERLVQWNSDLLLELLQNVVARREAVKGPERMPDRNLTETARSIGEGHMVVDEVAEIIDMPKFVCASKHADVQLSDEVVNQLRGYISEVASMYNSNPFHNFEHASHVTMSIHKLLTRIVAPKLEDSAGTDTAQQEALLHDYTYGITSDPLTQFAVVLSGLIHDLDHPGVSNGQLIQENPALGSRYQAKSVAEQNSVDLAWNILMSSAYDQLRDAIFATKAELQRFRSLLVNSVIATDIFDKDQSTLRKNRWNKAFFETTTDDTSQEARSRKATIVIEHLIQASDVAHTMQHWHVYQKWNQRLFNEMMMAYRAGRSDKDPSEGWYGGELWFFDNYVIPLTKKLKECGVFGVSSDEYLNYAMHNRDEWESKGKAVVQQYLEEFEKLATTESIANVGRLVI